MFVVFSGMQLMTSRYFGCHRTRICMCILFYRANPTIAVQNKYFNIIFTFGTDGVIYMNTPIMPKVNMTVGYIIYPKNVKVFDCSQL